MVTARICSMINYLYQYFFFFCLYKRPQCVKHIKRYGNDWYHGIFGTSINILLSWDHQLKAFFFGSFAVLNIYSYYVQAHIDAFLTHFDAFLTHFRLLVVVCLAAYAAGQGFRKKTSGPTTPATVQKQVAAGVSLFVCFFAKPDVEITRVLGPQWQVFFVVYISLLKQRKNSQKFQAHNSCQLYRSRWQQGWVFLFVYNS
jgi:hypothetical protein